MTHDLFGFLDHSRFPQGAQVCRLSSNDLGADLDDAAEAILLLYG